ncbi:MAG: Rne/Rng family ribonuclease [Candidatus Coproplasma sp.]
MSRKTLYFDSVCGTDSYAIVEDGKLNEFSYEPSDRPSIVGNIYKGKVTNVLNGMQAAFVNCGLERNCYISVEDLFPDHTKYDGKEVDIPTELKLNPGDEIMVQVVKAPVGKKGAKVTTNLSFVGKYTIYMPTTPFVGVSRKIADEELRKNLLYGAEKVKRGNEGLIVRTAAPYADRKEKLDELNYCRKLYQSVSAKFKSAAVGDLLYSDYPQYIRVLRDTMLFDVDKIHVGTPQLEKGVNEFIKLNPRGGRKPVILHDHGTDMFYSLGLAGQILSLTEPRVDLENGAYLIIEKTEALTVIDVNTGKFIGDDSLEHTVYCTNILAAREIARQVRLRNIAGIIVVDFIDMSNENHRKALVEELERALESDKAKCHVLPMSKIGLVEFTRKRVGTSIQSQLSRPCKHCNGSGHTRIPEFTLMDLRARLLDLLHKGNKAVCIDMNFEVANRLLNWKECIEDIKNSYPQARVYITAHRTFHEDAISFRVENSPTISLPEGTVLLY